MKYNELVIAVPPREQLSRKDRLSDNAFTILGSSSGVPKPDRVSSGYVLEVDNTLTLFDCGGGVTSAFLRQGFSFRDVSRIIISHAHSDHVCELTLFLQGMYLAAREDTVELYLPEEFVEIFHDYLTAVYLFPERFPFPFEVIGYNEQLVLDGAFRLKAHANSHLRKYREFVERSGGKNKMQCHSFEIDVGGTSLLYSADIGSFDDISELMPGKDVVILEMSHIDLDGFFEQAGDFDVGRYIVTHLEGSEQIAEIKRRAAKAVIGNLEIAFDGQRITV